MNKRIASFSLSLGFLLAAQAQFPSAGGILYRTERAMERKMEEKMEQKMKEKMAQKIDSLYQEDGSEPAASSSSSGSQPAAKIHSEYAFTHKVSARIIITEKGKAPSEQALLSYLSKEQTYAAYEPDPEQPQSLMINDYGHEVMITLSESGGKKTGTVLPIKAAGSLIRNMAAKQSSSPSSQPTFEFKKTGRSKTVAGYRCEEYVYTSDESKGEYWISTEAPAALNAWGQLVLNLADLPSGAIGAVLETRMENLKDGTVSVYRIESITPQNLTLKMSDYEVRDILGRKY